MAGLNEHINCAASPELLAAEQLAVLCNRNFLVAHWLVEPKANQLRYHGLQDHNTPVAQPQSLEPRIMFLLCVLAANAGNVVSRDNLMALLWPKVVVNENSLTRAVSELRKGLDTLANSSVGPCLIETIPKKGYRLNAHVTFNTTAPAAGSTIAAAAGSMTQIVDTARFTGYRALSLAALAASVAVIAVLLIWLLPADLTKQSEMLAISPAANGYVQTESTGTDAHNAQNEYINQAFQPTQSVLSRNGDLFAYISYNDAGSSLILGSITSFSSPVNVYETEELIFNLQWSPVDNILMFAQTPRFSPAAMSPDRELVRLVMFDISTMAATVVSGDDTDPLRKPFSLT